MFFSCLSNREVEPVAQAKLNINIKIKKWLMINYSPGLLSGKYYRMNILVGKLIVTIIMSKYIF